jgi:DNA-binding beta-propeller fold protein YncE
MSRFHTIVAPALTVLLTAACASEPGAGDDSASSPVVEGTQIALVGGFSGPESVRYDEEADVYFVGNFNGDAGALDNNGFISRMTPDGVVEELRFIAGGQNGVTLHSVRGMTIVGDTLWACDADAVRGFNRHTGEPVAEIDFTQLDPGFLNDITPGPDGELYVTDTPRNRIYRIDGRTPSIALEDEALNSPNGITWDRTSGQAVVIPFGGDQVLNRWGGEAPALEPIASGLPGGKYDGVEVLAYQRLVVSSQADSSIHVVRDGSIEASMKTVGAPADIGYDVRRNRVAVPFVALDQVQILEIPEPEEARP